MSDPFEEREKRLKKGQEGQANPPSATQNTSGSGGAPAGGGNRYDPVSEKLRIAADFFKRAENAAARRELSAAIALGEIVLKMVDEPGYEKYHDFYKSIVESWRKGQKIEQDAEAQADNWFGLSDEDIKKDMRKILDNEKARLVAGGKKQKDIDAALSALRKQLFDAQKKTKGPEGYQGYFTIADDISKITDEGRVLADDGIANVNPSKLERGIARLQQALNLAEENKFEKQVREIRPLIERYQANYRQILKLFNVSEQGRASPFADEKFKYMKDDVEVQRDDFDALATKLDIYRSRKDNASLDALKAWKKKLEDKYPSSKYPDADKALKSVENIINQNPESEEFAKNANDALIEVNAEAERAKRFGELLKTYPTRHEDKARDIRDKFRNRALTGHEHWGTGGWAASDAAEWIGFSRDPIETFGNLSATIITVYLIVWQIVGPILDTFAFFIPFLSVLKWPIFLVAIIILHPFMKAILHPIMKDVGFIAKDPYWYEEGTAVDSIRDNVYKAGKKVNDSVAEINKNMEGGDIDKDTGKKWVDSRVSNEGVLDKSADKAAGGIKKYGERAKEWARERERKAQEEKERKRAEKERQEQIKKENERRGTR